MNTLNRDRNTLKRLVESYGKKDVLSYVNHLDEGFTVKFPRPIWKGEVDFLTDGELKDEGPLDPIGRAYCSSYKKLASFVPIYDASRSSAGYAKQVFCYTPEQCQVFYDFMLDNVLWDNGELTSEPLSFLCPGLAELVPNRRPELEGEDIA